MLFYIVVFASFGDLCLVLILFPLFMQPLRLFVCFSHPVCELLTADERKCSLCLLCSFFSFGFGFVQLFCMPVTVRCLCLYSVIVRFKTINKLRYFAYFKVTSTEKIERSFVAERVNESTTTLINDSGQTIESSSSFSSESSKSSSFSENVITIGGSGGEGTVLRCDCSLTRNLPRIVL